MTFYKMYEIVKDFGKICFVLKNIRNVKSEAVGFNVRYVFIGYGIK